MSARDGYDPFMGWSNAYVSSRIELALSPGSPSATSKFEIERIPRPEPPTELVPECPAVDAPTSPDDDHDERKSGGDKATNDIPTQEISDHRTGPSSLGELQICVPAEFYAADPDVVESRDHPTTAVSHPAAPPAKRKYTKRKSQIRSLLADDKCAEIGSSDNARGFGADSLCLNVDDSTPPMKMAKSDDDGQVVGEGLPKTSRQCPKCLKVLNFRSERTAVGGYRLHISKCIKGTEIEDYSLVMKDSVPQQMPLVKMMDAPARSTEKQGQSAEATPSSPSPKEAEKRSQSAFVYSLTEDPIPIGHLKLFLRPRKSFVDPPDPRPCYGCNWCGQGRKEVEETLCPACKLLKDDGWFKWNDEVSKKVNFVERSNQMNCPSIRAFLEDTTVIITEKLKKMSPEEAKAFFSNLYEIEDVVERDGTPEERPRFSPPKKINQSVTPTTGSPFNVKTNARRGDTIEFPPPELADAIKSKLARRCQGVEKDVITSQRKHLKHLYVFVERKASVCGLDPRPSFGCGWCGVITQQDELCLICESLKEFGCSMKQYSTSVTFCCPTTKVMKGVKEYLSRSTDVVAEAVKLLSASDCALLREKYQQSDEIISTFTYSSCTQSHRSGSQGKKKIAPREAPNKSDKKRKPTGKTSITATKKSSGVTPSRSRSKLSHVTKEGDARFKNGVASPIIQVSLPTIPQLLDINLSEVLKADVFCVYNYHFGTNSNIAAKILLVLSEGQLPSCISAETPFLRSSEEILTLTCPSGTPPSRYIGVYRVQKILTDGKHEMSFGAAFPEFYVNCEWSSEIERTPNGHILPKVAKVNGRPLLLRIGIDDEELAGKLFSFCYRIMYGAVAASDIVAERNSLGTLACQESETTAPPSIFTQAQTDPPQHVT